MYRTFVIALELVFLLVAAMLAGRSAIGADRLPSPLVVDGRPIDPTCLMTLANGDSSRLDPIDLRHCHRADIVVTHDSRDPGMIGFEYKEKDIPDAHPYFYYRFLGAYHGHALLFIEFSGGGTGQFTNLVGVDTNGSVLKPVEELAGGDRCNGGIYSATVNQGRLSYDERITPFDLIALAAATPRMHADKDLESSAASCVAVVHHADQQWTSVTLSNPDWHDQQGWTEQYRYQACFNRIYRSYVAHGKTEMDRRGTARFGAAFGSLCLQRR